MSSLEARIATFPDVGGVFALPAGKLTFDLVRGETSHESLTNTPKLSDNLRNLKMSAFQSAVVFCDQPANLIMDDKTTYLSQGLATIDVRLKDKIIIDSYMPFTAALLLSTAPRPPLLPLLSSMPFKRFGNDTSGDAFAIVRMRPITMVMSKGGNALGRPLTNTVLAAANINSDEEGSPVTELVKNKTVIVENTDAADSVDVNIRGLGVEGQTFADDSSTGVFTTITAGNFGVFVIEKMWAKMQVRIRSTVAGNPATANVSMIGAYGAGS